MALNLKGKVGFTLVELAVVLLIVGLLMAIALPAYQGHATRVKRATGRAELLEALARQEQYFINHKRYAVSLDLLGYVSSPYAISSVGEVVAIDAPDRVYLMAIADISPADAPRAFTLQAIPQLGQVLDNRCGVLALTSTGIKSASAGTVAECW